MHTQRQDYHPKEYLGPHPYFSLEYLDRGFDRPKDLRARRAYGNMRTEPIAAVLVYRIVYDCGQHCYKSDADDGNDADNTDDADDADVSPFTFICATFALQRRTSLFPSSRNLFQSFSTSTCSFANLAASASFLTLSRLL